MGVVGAWPGGTDEGVAAVVEVVVLGAGAAVVLGPAVETSAAVSSPPSLEHPARARTSVARTARRGPTG